MKVVLFLSSLLGASAFAPATQSARPASSLAATVEELESMRGISYECGNKVVSIMVVAFVEDSFRFVSWLARKSQYCFVRVCYVLYLENSYGSNISGLRQLSLKV